MSFGHHWSDLVSVLKTNNAVRMDIVEEISGHPLWCAFYTTKIARQIVRELFFSYQILQWCPTQMTIVHSNESCKLAPKLPILPLFFGGKGKIILHLNEAVAFESAKRILTTSLSWWAIRRLVSNLLFWWKKSNQFGEVVVWNLKIKAFDYEYKLCWAFDYVLISERYVLRSIR